VSHINFLESNVICQPWFFPKYLRILDLPAETNNNTKRIWNSKRILILKHSHNVRRINISYCPTTSSNLKLFRYIKHVKVIGIETDPMVENVHTGIILKRLFRNFTQLKALYIKSPKQKEKEVAIDSLIERFSGLRKLNKLCLDISCSSLDVVSMFLDIFPKLSNLNSLSIKPMNLIFHLENSIADKYYCSLKNLSRLRFLQLPISNDFIDKMDDSSIKHALGNLTQLSLSIKLDIQLGHKLHGFLNNCINLRKLSLQIYECQEYSSTEGLQEIFESISKMNVLQALSLDCSRFNGNCDMAINSLTAAIQQLINLNELKIIWFRKSFDIVPFVEFSSVLQSLRSLLVLDLEFKNLTQLLILPSEADKNWIIWNFMNTCFELSILLRLRLCFAGINHLNNTIYNKLGKYLKVGTHLRSLELELYSDLITDKGLIELANHIKRSETNSLGFFGLTIGGSYIAHGLLDLVESMVIAYKYKAVELNVTKMSSFAQSTVDEIQKLLVKERVHNKWKVSIPISEYMKKASEDHESNEAELMTWAAVILSLSFGILMYLFFKKLII